MKSSHRPSRSSGPSPTTARTFPSPHRSETGPSRASRTIGSATAASAGAAATRQQKSTTTRTTTAACWQSMTGERIGRDAWPVSAVTSGSGVHRPSMLSIWSGGDGRQIWQQSALSLESTGSWARSFPPSGRARGRLLLVGSGRWLHGSAPVRDRDRDRSRGRGRRRARPGAEAAGGWPGTTRQREHRCRGPGSATAPGVQSAHGCTPAAQCTPHDADRRAGDCPDRAARLSYARYVRFLFVGR